jgi:hypothetical protein
MFLFRQLGRLDIRDLYVRIVIGGSIEASRFSGQWQGLSKGKEKEEGSDSTTYLQGRAGTRGDL